ncbi:conserved Plasmodium protein, unknown function [Plasmodium sp. gorilla clade G3]|nr:conserved Plasmodium protein, unknown function [Plasmodium sp. gorilla clade G3]
MGNANRKDISHKEYDKSFINIESTEENKNIKNKKFNHIYSSSSNNNNENSVKNDNIVKNNNNFINADKKKNVILNDDDNIKNKELVDESFVNIFFYENYFKNLFNLNDVSNNKVINIIEEKEGDEKHVDNNIKYKNILRDDINKIKNTRNVNEILIYNNKYMINFLNDTIKCKIEIANFISFYFFFLHMKDILNKNNDNELIDKKKSSLKDISNVKYIYKKIKTSKKYISSHDINICIRNYLYHIDKKYYPIIKKQKSPFLNNTNFFLYNKRGYMSSCPLGGKRKIKDQTKISSKIKSKRERSDNNHNNNNNNNMFNNVINKDNYINIKQEQINNNDIINNNLINVDVYLSPTHDNTFLNMDEEEFKMLKKYLKDIKERKKKNKKGYNSTSNFISHYVKLSTTRSRIRGKCLLKNKKIHMYDDNYDQVKVLKNEKMKKVQRHDNQEFNKKNNMNKDDYIESGNIEDFNDKRNHNCDYKNKFNGIEKKDPNVCGTENVDNDNGYKKKNIIKEKKKKKNNNNNNNNNKDNNNKNNNNNNNNYNNDNFASVIGSYDNSSLDNNVINDEIKKKKKKSKDVKDMVDKNNDTENDGNKKYDTSYSFYIKNTLSKVFYKHYVKRKGKIKQHKNKYNNNIKIHNEKMFLNDKKEKADPMNLGISFSPAGLLIPYHLGVSSLLIEKNILNMHTSIAGSSAGSICACCLSVGLSVNKCYFLIENIISNVYKHGCYQKLENILNIELNKYLYEDSYIYLNNRIGNVFVGITQILPYYKKLNINNFYDDNDLISAIIASCNIPMYLSSNIFVNFRNKKCIDGFFSTKKKDFGCPNTRTERIIKVSPFDSDYVGIGNKNNSVISPHLIKYNHILFLFICVKNIFHKYINNLWIEKDYLFLIQNLKDILERKIFDYYTFVKRYFTFLRKNETTDDKYEEEEEDDDEEEEENDDKYEEEEEDDDEDDDEDEDEDEDEDDDEEDEDDHDEEVNHDDDEKNERKIISEKNKKKKKRKNNIYNNNNMNSCVGVTEKDFISTSIVSSFANMKRQMNEKIEKRKNEKKEKKEKIQRKNMNKCSKNRNKNRYINKDSNMHLMNLIRIKFKNLNYMNMNSLEIELYLKINNDIFLQFNKHNYNVQNFYNFSITLINIMSKYYSENFYAHNLEKIVYKFLLNNTNFEDIEKQYSSKEDMNELDVLVNTYDLKYDKIIEFLKNNGYLKIDRYIYFYPKLKTDIILFFFKEIFLNDNILKIDRKFLKKNITIMIEVLKEIFFKEYVKRCITKVIFFSVPMKEQDNVINKNYYNNKYVNNSNMFNTSGVHYYNNQTSDNYYHHYHHNYHHHYHDSHNNNNKYYKNKNKNKIMYEKERKSSSLFISNNVQDVKPIKHYLKYSSIYKNFIYIINEIKNFNNKITKINRYNYYNYMNLNIDDLNDAYLFLYVYLYSNVYYKSFFSLMNMQYRDYLLRARRLSEEENKISSKDSCTEKNNNNNINNNNHHNSNYNICNRDNKGNLTNNDNISTKDKEKNRNIFRKWNSKDLKISSNNNIATNKLAKTFSGIWIEKKKKKNDKTIETNENVQDKIEKNIVENKYTIDNEKRELNMDSTIKNEKTENENNNKHMECLQNDNDKNIDNNLMYIEYNRTNELKKELYRNDMYNGGIINFDINNEYFFRNLNNMNDRKFFKYTLFDKNDNVFDHINNKDNIDYNKYFYKFENLIIFNYDFTLIKKIEDFYKSNRYKIFDINKKKKKEIFYHLYYIYIYYRDILFLLKFVFTLNFCEKTKYKFFKKRKYPYKKKYKDMKAPYINLHMEQRGDKEENYENSQYNKNNDVDIIYNRVDKIRENMNEHIKNGYANIYGNIYGHTNNNNNNNNNINDDMISYNKSALEKGKQINLLKNLTFSSNIDETFMDSASDVNDYDIDNKRVQPHFYDICEHIKKPHNNGINNNIYNNKNLYVDDSMNYPTSSIGKGTPRRLFEELNNDGNNSIILSKFEYLRKKRLKYVEGNDSDFVENLKTNIEDDLYDNYKTYFVKNVYSMRKLFKIALEGSEEKVIKKIYDLGRSDAHLWLFVEYLNVGIYLYKRIYTIYIKLLTVFESLIYITNINKKKKKMDISTVLSSIEYAIIYVNGNPFDIFKFCNLLVLCYTYYSIPNMKVQTSVLNNNHDNKLGSVHDKNIINKETLRENDISRKLTKNDNTHEKLRKKDEQKEKKNIKKNGTTSSIDMDINNYEKGNIDVRQNIDNNNNNNNNNKERNVNSDDIIKRKNRIKKINKQRNSKEKLKRSISLPLNLKRTVVKIINLKNKINLNKNIIDAINNDILKGTPYEHIYTHSNFWIYSSSDESDTYNCSNDYYVNNVDHGSKEFDNIFDQMSDELDNFSRISNFFKTFKNLDNSLSLSGYFGF